MKPLPIFLLLIVLTITNCKSPKYSSHNIESESTQGLYFEYKCSDKGKTEQTDVLKVYSLDGNTLNERTNLKYPTYPSKTLYFKSKPDLPYTLSERDKTYFKMRDSQLIEYRVTVLGKDSINNYHCTKIKVDTHERNDGQYSILWVTNEIPSYEKYITADVNNFNLTKLDKALREIGIGGLPVRIQYSEEASLQYDLVKIEFRTLDKSLFSLNNYHEAELMSSDQLKKKNKVSKEEYELMKKMEDEVKRDQAERAKNQK